MTFDDVQMSSRIAYLPLPNGTLLRYWPEDGTVRILAYPSSPDDWEHMPILHYDIPREGWSHLASCACGRCRPVASAVA